MKNNKLKKGLVFFTISIFIISSISAAAYPSLLKRSENRENIVIKLLTINNDGSLVQEKFSMDNQDFEKLKTILSNLFDKIIDSKDSSSISEIFQELNKDQNSVVLSKIIEYINNYFSMIPDKYINLLSTLNKNFIISQGWSYSLNLFKDSKYKLISRPVTLWHYCEESRADNPSLTFVYQPGSYINSEQTMLLKGKQIGVMLSFTGLYIYRAECFPKQSYTFFTGFAKRIISNGEHEYGINLPTK